MQKRNFRNPDEIKVAKNIQMTDDQYKTVKLAARELKMFLGDAIEFLSQNFLDELDSEPLN